MVTDRLIGVSSLLYSYLKFAFAHQRHIGWLG